jgi:hypothetical protein
MKTKPQSEEYTRFENFLGEVLTVSKEELNRRMKADEREKRTAQTPSLPAAVHRRSADQ